MAASPTRTALMRPSNSQLNIKPIAPPSSRKRKQPEQESVDGPSLYFTVKAVSTKYTPQAATFLPITTIDRRNIPLSWLNSAVNTAQLPLGYVFKTTDPCIQNKKHSILVARLQPNGGLYAIENVRDNVYTTWPLQNWVSEELCHDAAKGDAAIPQLAQLVPTRGQHSRTASISSETLPMPPTPVSPKKATNRRGAMARMSILTPLDRSDTSPFDDAADPIAPLIASPLGIRDESPAALNATEMPGAATLDRQIDNVATISDPAAVESSRLQPEDQRMSTPEVHATEFSALPKELDALLIHHQYFETLYHSKTSLAFWAKGPLSRARADCRKSERSFGLLDLKECYLSMVLPTKKIDLKYRDSIPELVKTSAPRSQQDEEIPKLSKKRSSKKSKLGKDCLYSGENEHVEKWWSARDLKPGYDLAATGEDMRKATADLRNRETEMQLLLLLEVLHLENLLSKTPDKVADTMGPDIKVESVENDLADVPTKPLRAKKKRDLSSELDTTAERLSIWHTVALEDMFSSPEKTRERSGTSGTKSKDKLRDFCRDVIIPFYSAKLPDHAKSICRKLGGPNLSPQRPRPGSSSSAMRPPSNTTSKPKSRIASKRPLERVLSEDQTARHASPPTLSRSSTAPQIPSLKRESSETETRPASRSSMQKSVSFSNREIDLVTEARVHDTKRRKLDKLATQKKELDDAIGALKKPNRSSAGRAFMDEIERRNVDAKGIGKRPDKQVHITATPRRAKSRSSSSHMLGMEQPSQPLVDPVIPSSTFKPSLPVPASSKQKRAVLSAIHDTPSRGLAKISNPMAMVQATLASDRLRPDMPLDTPLPSRLTMKSGKPVLFTPIKRKDVNAADALMFRDVPEIPEKAGKAMDRVMGGKGVDAGFALDLGFADTPRTDTSSAKSVKSNAAASKALGNGGLASSPKEYKSIYEQLGWDDDDDM